MFTEDLSLFFHTAQLADLAVIDGSAVAGIWAEEPVESNFVQTVANTFSYRYADKASVAIDSAVTFKNVSYLVKNIIPDGTGLVKLILEKV